MGKKLLLALGIFCGSSVLAQLPLSLPSIPALGASLVERRDKAPSVAVVQVGDKTPAAAAGLYPGDFVLRIGPHAITTVLDVISALDQVVPGASIEIVVRRGEQEKTLRVTPDLRFAATVL